MVNNNKPFDVVNIGVAVADIPLKIPCNAIDFSQDTKRLECIDMMSGGDAANTAKALAMLGKKTALLAVTGGDHFGHAIKTELAEYNVNTDYMLTHTSAGTGISVILINPSGERAFVCAGAGDLLNKLSAKDVDMSLLDNTRHINFGSLFSSPLFEREVLPGLFKAAREKGVTVSADVMADVHDAGFDGIRGCLEYVDYFMPSYIEGKYLSGETEPEKMADFFIRETGDKTVVIKLGEEGCFIKSGGVRLRVPAFEVEAADTTGAGDTFVAGFLAGLAGGWELERCAEFACAAAAFGVRYVGATTREMNMDRVLDFMKKTPRKAHSKGGYVCG